MISGEKSGIINIPQYCECKIHIDRATGEAVGIEEACEFHQATKNDPVAHYAAIKAEAAAFNGAKYEVYDVIPLTYKNTRDLGEGVIEEEVKELVVPEFEITPERKLKVKLTAGIAKADRTVVETAVKAKYPDVIFENIPSRKTEDKVIKMR
jgi:hypothetical protein